MWKMLLHLHVNPNLMMMKIPKFASLSNYTYQINNTLNACVKYMFCIRPKKKIGVFTVCRPTLFYSCRPYHFFSENEKKTDRFPVLLQRFRILIPVFKFFADSILFGM